MAARKKPELGPVVDSSVADDSTGQTFMLGEADFNRYVRMCFYGKAGEVQQLRDTAASHLKRLRAKPNASKAVTSPKEASEQYNLQSLYRWMEKLERGYRKAVGQLTVLHATASRRLGS